MAVLLLMVGTPTEAKPQVVVAHAGGKAHSPENTLPAISTSFDVGATWVEVDVRLTVDSIAMLMHDSTVDRTTDGTGEIGSKTVADVKLLDAGSYFGSEFIGTQVPTVEEALAIALGRGPLLIDMKDSIIGSQVAAALGNLNATPSDIVLWATSTAEVIEAQTFLSGSPIFYRTTLGSTTLVQQLADLGVDGVSILHDSLTPSLVDLAHDLGLQVFVWGANTHGAIAEALYFGVDGIHHKDPGFVLDFLAEDDCSDGADNDQDGFIDFPDDLGCTSPLDGSEQPSLVSVLNPAVRVLLVITLIAASYRSIRYVRRAQN